MHNWLDPGAQADTGALSRLLSPFLHPRLALLSGRLVLGDGHASSTPRLRNKISSLVLKQKSWGCISLAVASVTCLFLTQSPRPTGS